MSVINDIRVRVWRNESGLIRHAVGIFCVLFTLRDPYDVRIVPRILSESRDEKGHPVRMVAANNYRDVDKFSGNIEGGRVVHTRVGDKTWRIHVEEG